MAEIDSREMPRSRLQRIRDCIRRRHYDMTAHAMEEMAEDLLDVIDIEKAALTGRISSIGKDDPRGTRYVVTGLAADETRPVAVVGRFVETGRFLVITVYEVS